MTSNQISFIAPSVEIGVAAVIASPFVVEAHYVPTADPGPGEIRVRLEGCGICGSNLSVWEGRPWFAYPMPAGSPGHEGWGKVDAVGRQVTAFRTGDRVAILSDHAFAEYDVTSELKAISLPQALDSEYFPAEPLACAMNVIRRSGIERGQSVAIVGIGFLGALLTKLATLRGAKVVGISRRRFALNTAVSFGADTAFDLHDPSRTVADALRWNQNRYFDCVIEASGTQQTLDLAAQLVRERGRLVIAGYHQDSPRKVDMQLWNWRGIDVINAHERDPQMYVQGMREAVEMVMSGALDPGPLYTHAFSLNDISKALEVLRLRPEGFMKALVIP